MTRQEKKSPTKLLVMAGDALARASRCREALELDAAFRAYDEAMQFVRTYDELDELTRKDTEQLRQQIEAECLLVEALLYAHDRSYLENISRFTLAHSAAQRVSLVHQVRVLCCMGCVLIFEGLPDEALKMFSLAEEKLGLSEGMGLERTQLAYHRARALIAARRHDEAIKLLERLTSRFDALHTQPIPNRYTLAAMALLASQYQRKGRFVDARTMARYGLGVAHFAGLQATNEALQLNYMARWWHYWAYVHWVKRSGVPEL